MVSRPTMRWSPTFLALLLVTAGCLGGTDGSQEPVQQARADVSSSTGGVEGTVTDPAIQPIGNATVQLVEANRTTEAKPDGSFAFSNVQPGTYTVEANATGFLADQQEVTVRAEQIATVDFLLAHAPTTESYTQTWEMRGFFECGFAAGYDASAAPPPANRSGGVISWPFCATVNSLAGNATNDDFDEHFTTEPNLRTLVVETRWDPSAGSLSDQLWVDIVPQGFHCGNITKCKWSLLDHWGPSPLVGRVNDTRIDSIQSYFERRCNNGTDEYCGHNFEQDGWPLWIRVYPRWECQPAGPQACVLVQQEFTHVTTAFYNEPAPAGFTALE